MTSTIGLSPKKRTGLGSHSTGAAKHGKDLETEEKREGYVMVTQYHC